MSQAQCTLTADEGGRVLDRLAGLEQVIRREDIQQALAATPCVDSPGCRLTHEVVCWIVLAMGLFTDLPIRQVFTWSRRLRLVENLPQSFQPLRRAGAAGGGVEDFQVEKAET